MSKCKYCQYSIGNESIYESNCIDLEVFDNHLLIDVGIQYEGTKERAKINYCPMCGRKLEGTE